MIIKFEKLKNKKPEFFLDKIFIYPTDTIYGIGCDAENEFLVDKISEIKKRDIKPFSVIAPSVEWILENCETTKEEIEKFLPGAYTLILKKKDGRCIYWQCGRLKVNERLFLIRYYSEAKKTMRIGRK